MEILRSANGLKKKKTGNLRRRGKKFGDTGKTHFLSSGRAHTTSTQCQYVFLLAGCIEHGVEHDGAFEQNVQ